jgi:hypothetical protein
MKLIDLNTEFQVRQKLIFWYVWGCQRFWNEAETVSESVGNADMCYLSSYDILHEDGSVCIPFPSVRAEEMFVLLPDNFKMWFNGFRCYGTFCTEVGCATDKLKFQQIKLQHDLILRNTTRKL